MRVVQRLTFVEIRKKFTGQGLKYCRENVMSLVNSSIGAKVKNDFEGNKNVGAVEGASVDDFGVEFIIGLHHFGDVAGVLYLAGKPIDTVAILPCFEFPDFKMTYMFVADSGRADVKSVSFEKESVEEEGDSMSNTETIEMVKQAKEDHKFIHDQYAVLKLQVTVLEELVRQSSHRGRAHEAAVKVIECMSERDDDWWKKRVNWTTKRWLEELSLVN